MADKLEEEAVDLDGLEEEYHQVRRAGSRARVRRQHNALTFRPHLHPYHPHLQVLGGLSGDKTLEKFKHEYEKLYGALRKVRRLVGCRPAHFSTHHSHFARPVLPPSTFLQSHDNESKLIKKLRDVNSELIANGASPHGRGWIRTSSPGRARA